LLPATSRAGEPYDDLEELYGRMLGQWATELTHVTQIVGGFNSQQKHGGQDGVRFTIVPKEKQAAAVRFLNDNAFATPTWALKADILRRIEPSGAITRVNAAQLRVLNSLMNNARFDRLVEQEAIDGAAAYRAGDFMADVRKGIWGEIEGGPVRIDVYRRNLQNSYIDLLSQKLNGRPAVDDEYRSMIRAELRDLSADITTASARATDRAGDCGCAGIQRPAHHCQGFQPPARFRAHRLDGADVSADRPDPGERRHPLFALPDLLDR